MVVREEGEPEMPTIFTIKGPRKVLFTKKRAARVILKDNINEFWEKNKDLGERRGCYVFGMRSGKGLTPAYVGKATKSFKGEVFSYHKLTRYHQVLADYQKGTPILFFVVAPQRRGAPNLKYVAQLEKFLIQVGVAANPYLLNERSTKPEEWGIAGVLRSGKGKPSRSARLFRKLMKY
jgi:hypothetical protein